MVVSFKNMIQNNFINPYLKLMSYYFSFIWVFLLLNYLNLIMYIIYSDLEFGTLSIESLLKKK